MFHTHADMPQTFFGLLLLALLFPFVLRINKRIERWQIDGINRRRVRKQLKEVAATCKQHLRDTHAEKGAVEEFIVSIEGIGDGRDDTWWGQFRDIKDQYRDIEDIREEMLKRVDAAFESRA